MRQYIETDYRWFVSEDEERFASNLRSIREEAGLTQAALAKEMTRSGFRWHQATVYKVENGERQIQLGEARCIAAIFGMSLDDMLKSPQEAKFRRQLDYDINRFQNAHDRIAEAVCSFETARQTLALSVEDARSIAAANPEISDRIRVAEDLLRITPRAAFDTGVAASSDPEVVVEDYAHGRSAFIRKAFRERYGLVKERPIPSEAEAIARLENMSDDPDA